MKAAYCGPSVESYVLIRMFVLSLDLSKPESTW